MIKKELIVAKDPKSPISETFRALRTNLQFMTSIDQDVQTILITSTSPSEGKSWTAANIAITFAQASKRTCIVDVDMRKGRLHTMFNAVPTPGVSNYLTGVNVSKDITDITGFIQETEMPMLYLIPAGNVPPNPSELLISEKMEQLVNELKEHVDVIVFDGTPCNLVTDAAIVSRLVDQTLIVSAYNETKMEDLKDTKRKIENAGGKVAGVILNKLPTTNKKYGERYYYGKR